MSVSTVPDFLAAVLADARYEAEALKWEEARRVEERIDRKREEDGKAGEASKSTVETMIYTGTGPAKMLERLERLSIYDQALVEALQANREALDASEEQLDALLTEAHVLEDGRRVFKAEDGLRVVDEQGQALGADEIDPDRIEDWRPSAETYLSARVRHQELLETQAELIDYQTRLDEAQDRLAEGDLSEEEVEALDDLLGDAPTALRAHLPASDPKALRSEVDTAETRRVIDPSASDVQVERTTQIAFQ